MSLSVARVRGFPPGSAPARMVGLLGEAAALAHQCAGQDRPAGAVDALGEEVQALAAAQDRVRLGLARMAARFAAGGGLAAAGHVSLGAWLGEACGTGRAEAAALARVASHLAEYPDSVAAAEAGEISFAALEMIMAQVDKALGQRPADRFLDAREFREPAEEIMLGAARSGVGLRQLRRLGTELLARLAPEVHERGYRDRYASRGARCVRTLDGGFHLEAWGDEGSQVVLRTALDHFTAPPTPGDERTRDQRLFDGLIQLAETTLNDDRAPTGAPAGQARGPRPHVTLVVPLERLLLDHGAAPAYSDLGQVVPASLARAMAGDCVLRRIVTDPLSGEPVDLGRDQRLFPPRFKDARTITHPTCEWPDGCAVPARWCQLDHHTEWWEDGTSHLRNARLLCGRHNREKHRRSVHAHYTRTTGPDP